jgi:hypothetical protein
MTLAATSYTSAQSDPGPLFLPFEEDQRVEVGASWFRTETGHVKKSDESFALSQYQSQGRVRLTDQYKVNPVIGYDALLLDLKTSNETVPRNLSDVSIGFATPFKQFDNGWYLAGSVGLGFAGDELFNYSEGYYGKATFIVGKEFDERTSLLVALSYDGNRTAYPDIPLPAIAFTKIIHSTLELGLGIPYTTVRYRPTDRWLFEATVSIDDISGRVEYDLTEHVRLFAAAESIGRAFRLDELENNDRLLFEQRRAEVGVLLSPTKYVGITVAAGYAFSQEFSVGFDSRDTDLAYKFSDEAYGRVGLVWRP